MDPLEAILERIRRGEKAPSGLPAGRRAALVVMALGLTSYSRESDRAIEEKHGVGCHSIEVALWIKRRSPAALREVAAGLDTGHFVVKRLKGEEDKSPARSAPKAKGKKSALSLSDVERGLTLEAWETRIEARMEAFLDVAKALWEIRERRLYLKTHGMFRRYLQDRWGISMRDFQVITAAIDTPHLAWRAEEEPCGSSR
jgi:hypothetical protein